MISCTYSLPLHEELNFSRPLGILKSEKKMIGNKILLNSMRASSPWDAGQGKMLRGWLFTFGVVFPVRSDFDSSTSDEAQGPKETSPLSCLTFVSLLSFFFLGLTFSLGPIDPRNALAAWNNEAERLGKAEYINEVHL